METIIYEAFQTFRSEGVHYGSLGVAPLAGLDDEKASLVERLLRFVYNNLNENDPMPYSYGSTLSVREFRGSSNARVLSDTMASCLLCLPSEASDSGYVLRSGKDPEPGRDPRGRSVFPEGKNTL